MSMWKSGKLKSPPFCKEFEGKNILYDTPGFSISPDVLKSETTSAFVKANARGCAKLASILANGGGDLISQKSWNEMHSEPRPEVMFDLDSGPIRTNFTKGGVNFFTKLNDANTGEDSFSANLDGFYGWMGYGGSILQWNPEKKIGFAFIPTYLDIMNQMRGGQLQKAVVDCIVQK